MTHTADQLTKNTHTHTHTHKPEERINEDDLKSLSVCFVVSLLHIVTLTHIHAKLTSLLRMKERKKERE
jgi:hypothetical protein